MSLDDAKILESRALAHMRRIRQFEENGDSDIQRMFSGAVVLITGGTGFIGKQLLEKLFRACRGIEKIYLICRSKKGKPVAERIAEQLKDPVYDTLRSIYPDFDQKIIPIEGDIEDLRLGMKRDDWIKICDEANFIFHVAATVRFDEPLKKCIITNVRGTRELLTLARECKELRSLVYVSTAYAHCNRSTSGEKFYPSPVPPNTMIELVETVDEARIDAMTVTPAYREPAPGWLDKSNCYGPSGAIIGAGLGLVRTIHIRSGIQSDFVPVDFVNNLVVAASWDTVQRQARGELGIRIYMLSRKRNAFTMEQFYDFMNNDARNYPSPETLWYCFCMITTSSFMYKVYSLFLHYIPAFFIDLVLALMGQKIRLLKIYKTIYKLNNLVSFFVFNSFLFHDDNTLALYNKMSKTDQEIFMFDVKNIKFKEFLTTWCIGLRKYVVKDGLEGTQTARTKQFWLRLLNCIIIFIYLWIILKVSLWSYSGILAVIKFVFYNVCKI